MGATSGIADSTGADCSLLQAVASIVVVADVKGDTVVERVVMVVKEVVGVLRMVKVVRMLIAVLVVRETRTDQSLVFLS